MLQSPGTRSRFIENSPRSPYKGVPGRGSPLASQRYRANSPTEQIIARVVDEMGEPEGDCSNPLHATEEERDKAVGELKEMKTAVQDANSRLSAALTTQPELDSVKNQLSTSNQELKVKSENAASLKSEAERAKNLEAKLAEKDSLIRKLREEVKSLKKTNSPRASMDFRGARIRELEQELERKNESETKLLDSLVTQTKQLEETKISLEESKLLIASLTDKMEKSSFRDGHGRNPEMFPMDNEADKLLYELWLVKENLSHAEETEKIASLKVETLVDELNSVRNELKMVSEAEEHGKKAMDELAFALKEVATEANEVKEQLTSTRKELEKAKSEAAQSKFLLKSMESRCRTLLDEARKESEKHKNTSERLRIEAEESLMAWHEKETMFVECIRNVEEEKAMLQKENNRLADALAESKNKINTSKDENKKLRDILKQALNESNVAKEAAAIAREENSQLKDSVAEKESALEILSQEIENLRMSEAIAYDNVKELKKLLRQSELSQQGFKTQYSIDRDNNNSGSFKKLGRHYSMDVKSALKSTGKPLTRSDQNEKRNETRKDEALKGSIFDTWSPMGHGASPNRKKSLSLSIGDEASMSSPEFEQQEEGKEDDAEQESENEKNARKRKTLFKRFGSMLSRKSFQRRELNVE